MWIDADAQRKAAYGTVLADLAALDAGGKATRETDASFNELQHSAFGRDQRGRAKT